MKAILDRLVQLSVRVRLSLMIGILVILVLVIGVMLSVKAPGVILVVEHVSRSTNTAAMTITVYADGGVQEVIAGRNGSSAPSRTNVAQARTFNTGSLSNDLQQIADVATIKTQQFCVKSASFGVTTTIEYRGRVSGDLSCGLAAASSDTARRVVDDLRHIREHFGS